MDITEEIKKNKYMMIRIGKSKPIPKINGCKRTVLNQDAVANMWEKYHEDYNKACEEEENEQMDSFKTNFLF